MPDLPNYTSAECALKESNETSEDMDDEGEGETVVGVSSPYVRSLCLEVPCRSKLASDKPRPC